MGRKKNYLQVKVEKRNLTVIRIEYPNVPPISTDVLYHFIQLHKLPCRKPIVNIITAHIYENNVGKKEYNEIYEKYNLTEERIRNTLTSTNGSEEPGVIHSLCEYFGINEQTGLHDCIANYDFEEKRKTFKKGRKSKEDKRIFVEEFKKSWSEETNKRYMKEIEEYEERNGWNAEATWEIEEDSTKKAYMEKFSCIYDQYFNFATGFCDSFIEDDML